MFHIIDEELWNNTKGGSEYVPQRYEIDGFIHLSGLHQVLRPANLLYQGRDDLLLLEISVAALTAELRYEPGSHGEDEMFPHLYGALNIDAVQAVHGFGCLPDGSFELPRELDQKL